MKHIAQGTVIKNHDLTQVRLYLSKILDVGPVAECAVLSVVSSGEVLALNLQPVNDGISILLHRSSEDDQIVPLADLGHCERRHHNPTLMHTFFKNSSQYGRLWT